MTIYNCRLLSQGMNMHTLPCHPQHFGAFLVHRCFILGTLVPCSLSKSAYMHIL